MGKNSKKKDLEDSDAEEIVEKKDNKKKDKKNKNDDSDDDTPKKKDKKKKDDSDDDEPKKKKKGGDDSDDDTPKKKKKDDSDDDEPKKKSNSKKGKSDDGVEVESNLQMPVDKVDVKFLIVKPMTTDPVFGTSSQLLYDDPIKGELPLTLQLDSTKLNTIKSGIPQIHDKYAPTDDKRQFLNHPLDITTANGKKQLKAFKKIDEFMSSKETKKTIFGDKYKNAVYIPLARVPKPKEKLDRNGKPKTLVPFLKCVFKFSRGGKPDDDDDDDDDKKKKSKSKDKKKGKQTLETYITVDGKEPKNEDGEPLKLASMTDVETIIPWGSTIKHIIQMRSIWIGEEDEDGRIKYTLRIRIIKLDTVPGKGRSNPKTMKFLDEGENFDEDAGEKKKKKTNNRGKKDSNDSDGE